MATIKSFTSLEQSKKLTEILPIESADMYYTPPLIKGHTDYIPRLKRKFPIDWDIEQAIPCWSLAALLDILPDCIVMNKDFQTGKYHFCSIYAETFVTADNPIDACYEFIVKYMN